MFEAVFPNLTLLFEARERLAEVSRVPSSQRKRMIRQALRDYGHWLDRDTLARMMEELDDEPMQGGQVG